MTNTSRSARPDSALTDATAAARTPRAKRSDAGFSLLEIAIVLLVFGLLLGGLINPLSDGVERSRRATTQAQLQTINQALVGFAIANERLPCPASATSAGREDPLGGGLCSTKVDDIAHGFIPAASLALLGPTDADGLLLDAWGNPLRYSVSQIGDDASPNFTTQGAIRSAGAGNLTPNIVVCTRASTSPNCTGTTGNALRANQIPALSLSMGADWRDYRSADQLANAGEQLAAGSYASHVTTPSGKTHALPRDAVFVSKPYNQIVGDRQFDDLVIWLSENALYTQLLQAGLLP